LAFDHAQSLPRSTEFTLSIAERAQEIGFVLHNFFPQYAIRTTQYETYWLCFAISDTRLVHPFVIPTKAGIQQIGFVSQNSFPQYAPRRTQYEAYWLCFFNSFISDFDIRASDFPPSAGNWVCFAQ